MIYELLMPGPFDEAFADLYHRFYDRVVSLLLSFGFARERARELAQDVFVRVYRGMEAYRRESEWMYLKKITRNLALNALRGDSTAKRKANTVSLDDPSIHAADQHDNPERGASKSQTRRRLQTAIATLPPRLQETLRLYLAGCSYRDIEKALRITGDAVKTRLHEARIRLREILGEAPEEIE